MNARLEKLTTKLAQSSLCVSPENMSEWQDDVSMVSIQDLKSWYPQQNARVKDNFFWIVSRVLAPDSARELLLSVVFSDAVEERAAAKTYVLRRELDAAVMAKESAMTQFGRFTIEIDEQANLIAHYKAIAERHEHNYDLVESALRALEIEYNKMNHAVQTFKAAQAALLVL